MYLLHKTLKMRHLVTLMAILLRKAAIPFPSIYTQSVNYSP